MIQFMVTLSCIQHSSKSSKILIQRNITRGSGSVVTRITVGREARVRTPQVTGRPGVFHSGPGALNHF